MQLPVHMFLTCPNTCGPAQHVGQPTWPAQMFLVCAYILQFSNSNGSHRSSPMPRDLRTRCLAASPYEHQQDRPVTHLKEDPNESATRDGTPNATRDIQARVLSKETEEEGSHRGLHSLQSFAGLKTKNQNNSNIKSEVWQCNYSTLVR